MARSPHILRWMLCICLLAWPALGWSQTTDPVLILPDGSVAPSVSMVYQRARNQGRGGTAAALAAWPATAIGLLFTQTDTRFSRASGRAGVGMGLFSAVIGVPLMLHAGSQGARVVRLARPDHKTTLITVGLIFDGVSVTFGALAAASIAGDWANGQRSAWLVRPTTLGLVSALTGVTAFLLAKVQLDNNIRAVRSLDYHRAQQQAEAGRNPVRVLIAPTLTATGTGVAVLGQF